MDEIKPPRPIWLGVLAAPAAAGSLCALCDAGYALRAFGLRWIPPLDWLRYVAEAWAAYVAFGVAAALLGRALAAALRRFRPDARRARAAAAGPGFVVGVMAAAWCASAHDASFLFDSTAHVIHSSLWVWIPAGAALVGAALRLAKAAIGCARGRQAVRRWLWRFASLAASVVLLLVGVLIFAEFAFHRGVVSIQLQIFASEADTTLFSLSQTTWAVAAAWAIGFAGVGLAAGWTAQKATAAAPRAAKRAAAGVVILFFAAWATTVVAAAAVQPPARREALPGSVALLTVDALRPDFLSCYGGRVSTPHVDALAKQGILFERAVAAAPWTRPSFASIMLSVYPTTHGVGERGIVRRGKAANAIPKDLTTLAEAFLANGYATHAFIANSQLVPAFGFRRGFDGYLMYEDVRRRLDWLSLEEAVRPGRVIARRARRLITGSFLWRRPHPDEHARRHRGAILAACDMFLAARAIEWMRTARQPFFLWIHLMGAHEYTSFRYRVGPPARADDAMGRLEQIARGARIEGPVMLDPFTCERQCQGLRFWPPAWDLRRPIPAGLDMNHYAERYADNLRFDDAVIGALLRALDAAGVTQSGVIAFASDHGEEFGEHGGGWHGRTVYQEVIHTPLILVSPGRLPAGRKAAAWCSLIDLAPTLLELAGAPTPGSFAGRSLLPFISDPAKPHPAVYAEFLDDPAIERKALIESSIKCITAGKGSQAELYDLSADPGERRDLAQQRPYRLEEMLRRLHAWEQDQDGIARRIRHGRQGRVTITPEMDDMLKALGYQEE